MKTVRVAAARNPFDLLCDDIAPDKSISHRSAMFALLSDRPSRVKNYLRGEDTLATLSIVRSLGVAVEEEDEGAIRIVPPERIVEPEEILDCGNAGTAMRLFCGLLAGVEGSFVLTGDRYLRRRPMRRVVDPLRKIGAAIDGREGGNLAPLHIRGGALEPFEYHSPVDSAQVKSALILAALRAKGTCRYKENFLSRDHTERMLLGMGAELRKAEEGWIEIEPLAKPLKPLDLRIPADPSSAFFFAVAAAIVPGSVVRFTEISLNPTRIEAFRV
ncbi:3-phosphoshikimate 1-carboxyvinyltransferase, partial [Nitratifractor sp.]